MEYREKILAIARSAPVLPTQIGKALGVNSMMSGAMLSEMVSNNLLCVSSVKVGGSPVYYIKGNESQLLSFVQYLNEKDRRTLDLLKSKGVIRDSEVDPLVQVGLRSVKDFAKPLQVSFEGKQELFWKWFLLSDSDTESVIRSMIEPPKVVAPEPVVQESVKPEVVEPRPKVVRARSQTQLSENSVSNLQPKTDNLQPTTANLKPKTDNIKPDGDFWFVVSKFFDESKISIRECVVVKKGKEFDVLIDVASPLGDLPYFCKVKCKKRLSDGDLSSAYVQGQIKKLPVILVSDGELSKSAKLLLPDLKGLTVSQVKYGG